MSKALGQAFMPWQQLVADISGEVDPRTGLPVYREVIVLVPRQSGKTTLLLGSMVHRAWAFGRPQTIRYTAQTGDDALVKWNEHVEILSRSPFAQLYHLDKVNGRQALQWSNGSRHAPTATTTKSGHGTTLDDGVIDEAFAQIDFRTEQSMRPAMITRRDAQLWIVSTVGDATSIFLNHKIAENRARLEAEPDAPSRVAYFEWSLDPSLDPADPLSWATCMPALNRTINLEEVRAEHEGMTARDFGRAFLNLTDTGATADTVVEAEDWSWTGDDTAQMAGTAAIALDITNDRSWTSVAAAGMSQSGFAFAEVLKHERGTHWIIPFLIANLPAAGIDTVYVVAGSQAALMHDDLENAGLTVGLLSRADYAAGCATYYDGIVNRTSRHRATGQLPLDIAIAGAAWGTGDARTWSRVKSTTDISPLVACTAATWAYTLEAANDYDIRDSVA